MNSVVRAVLPSFLLFCATLSVPAQKAAPRPAPLLSPELRLFTAIDNDKPDVVRALIAQGVNLEARNTEGDTPLLSAIQSRRTAIMQLLLDAGASPQAVSGQGNFSALHWAVMTTSVPCVQMLLDRHIAVDVRDQHDQTPLFTAIVIGDTTLVRLLLDHGADIEARDKSANTPLIQAAMNGNLDIVRLLLEHGANLDAVNQSGQNALAAARAANYSDAASLLSDKMQAAAAQRALDNKLIDVIAEDNADKAQLLLDAGARIEARLKGTYSANYSSLNVDNITPLLLAVGANKPALVRLLLARGARIDDGAKIVLYYYPWISGTISGFYTPLTLAILREQLPIVQQLLAQGVNIEARDPDGRTPLLFAIDQGRTEIAKLLLQKGADPEARDSKSQAALQHAALQGNIEIGNLLRNGNTRYRQLEQTQWSNPNERFSAYVSALANDPQSPLLRRRVIELAAALPAPPSVTEEAKLLFQQANQQILTAATPAALEPPIALLRKVINIAPWWANPYYNLARAFEMAGKFDDAIAQLGFYLAANPSPADADEARTRIAALRTAKAAAGSR